MGRVKRKAGLAVVAPPPEESPATCALCERPLGRRIEWHHVIPKSRGGRDTVALHPICHSTIHAQATNTELARLADIEALRERPEVAKFLAWIAGKDPDFHVPTKRKGN